MVTAIFFQSLPLPLPYTCSCSFIKGTFPSFVIHVLLVSLPVKKRVPERQCYAEPRSLPCRKPALLGNKGRVAPSPSSSPWMKPDVMA
jgi:hypothetical protein